MRLERLSYYANAICLMFKSQRLDKDLETLAELPDGQLSIDILRCTSIHDSYGMVRLHVSEEIQGWLKEMFEIDSIPWDQFQRVEVIVDMSTSHVPTDKTKIVCFALSCHSVIVTDEYEYYGEAKSIKWYDRINL